MKFQAVGHLHMTIKIVHLLSTAPVVAVDPLPVAVVAPLPVVAVAPLLVAVLAAVVQ